MHPRYKVVEKRKMEPNINTEREPKKIQPLKDTPSDAAIRDMEFCASLAEDIPTDHPSALPNGDLLSSHESDDSATSEGSHINLSQDGETQFSDPNINSPNSDCDSVGEEVTMSMMKILLPQAVPLLRKARKKEETADVSSLDGKKDHSICQDHSKTKQAVKISKDSEQLPDVPDSCDELDDNACAPDSREYLNNAYIPDACEELDNNAYVPDSCDELDENAYAPDSCDELDENAYAPDSCDELDENACIPDSNAYVPDSCDELDYNLNAPDLCGLLDKEAYVPDSCEEPDENTQAPVSHDEFDDKESIQDSPKQLNEIHYNSDSSDKHKLDETHYVPDSCDESDNVRISTRFVTDVDTEKVIMDSNDRAWEGEAVTCNTRVCEYEGDSKDNLKCHRRFNLTSQSQRQIQDTKQTSHLGITNVSTDDLHGGTCPVFSNGFHVASDNFVSESDPNAGSNRACTDNHNLYENMDKSYDDRCAENNNGQCTEAVILSVDMRHSTNVLHDKTTSGSEEHFARTRNPPDSFMVKDGMFMQSEENVTSIPKALHLEQSALVHDCNVTVGRIDFDSKYPNLSFTKEPEKKPSGCRKQIELPSYDNEFVAKGKNLYFQPQASNHKQSASVAVDNTSSGLRTFFDGHCSNLSTAIENEKRLNSFGDFDDIDWDKVTEEELLMCDKMANSITETQKHKHSTSVDDSNKLGCKAFDGSQSVPNTAIEREKKLCGFGKLIGHYVHPKPVLSVLLCSRGNETYICTSCGTLQDNQRTLFVYNLKVEGTNAGQPYFVGHSPMILPDPECFGRQIALDKSGLQFTPNGQNLVLLNGMQLPSCRNRLVQCQCLKCETCSCEANAVKIVQLKYGYATVLAKLKTVHRVLCLLVCEPNYLVAVEANGAFRFWTMNSTWRYMTKEYILPPTDYISPCVIELKQISNCPHLVVGHNGLGEFGLWDISRHTIISRFFIPDTAVFRFIPLSLYSHSRKENSFTCLHANEQPSSLKNTSTPWSSKYSVNTNLNLYGEKDLAISVLVATCPDIKSSYQSMPDGCWKSGLLMNNKVFLNNTLDARAVTVAALGDCGILGTNQGYLHVWDLSTEMKLGDSQCFKDGRVQCLYTENTRSDLLAVADDSGNLLLYLQG